MNPKRVLLERLEQMHQTLRERDGLVVNDVAEDVERIRTQVDRELEVLRLNRSTHAVHEIEAALQRVDQGDYGICMDCEEEISPKRLAALPWATRCIRCQEAADTRKEQHGTDGEESQPAWKSEVAA